MRARTKPVLMPVVRTGKSRRGAFDLLGATGRREQKHSKWLSDLFAPTPLYSSHIRMFELPGSLAASGTRELRWPSLSMCQKVLTRDPDMSDLLT